VPLDPWVGRPRPGRIGAALEPTKRLETSPKVIYVTRLDGSQLVVNSDLIETVEHTADTVITLLDGKKLVVKTLVDEVVESIIGYRQLIARGPLRMVDGPNLASASAAIHPIPIRSREND
jgi:flagellar protein FlbD